jgi:glycosyltransferase involved in cell wall biosynthesis
MAVYNEENNVSRAIDSILNQTMADLELIIVNDGSTDHTLEVISRYDDKRIIVINKERNSGLADSLNIGITQARTGLIARQDADDFSQPNRLETQIDYLIHNPGVAVVGSWGYSTNDTGQKKELKMPTTDIRIRQFMQKDNPFIHTSVVFRKEEFEKAGRYKVGLEDYDLWIRLAKGNKVANLPFFLVTRHEADNFNSRPYYQGKKKRDIYNLRLRCQLKAMLYFGIHIKTLYYLSKTLIRIMLPKN